MSPEKQQRMVALFDKHVGADLDDDLDNAMAGGVDKGAAGVPKGE